MITYEYATTEDNQIISIQHVTNANRYNKFYCLGCSSPLTPVLAKFKAKHFRHRSDVCSRETYLHRLGKYVLKSRFENQEHFTIEFLSENTCNLFSTCELKKHVNWKYCRKRNDWHKIDLKKYYDTCSVERSYNGFKGDLVLTHSNFKEQKPIFIEIVVSHSIGEEKSNSGINIIEIFVQNEKDLFASICENDTSTEKPLIHFYNFKRTHMPISEHKYFYLETTVNNLIPLFHRNL